LDDEPTVQGDEDGDGDPNTEEATPTDSDVPEQDDLSTDASGPGFGPIVALAGLVLTALAMVWRDS
jgi:PGF-CTERM protein